MIGKGKEKEKVKVNIRVLPRSIFDSDERVLLDHVGVNTLGILWLCDLDLSKHPHGYSVMDYLLDGGITTAVKRIESKIVENNVNNVNNVDSDSDSDSDEESKKGELFVSQAFDRNFYLRYIKLSCKKELEINEQTANACRLVDEFKNFINIVKSYNVNGHIDSVMALKESKREEKNHVFEIIVVISAKELLWKNFFTDQMIKKLEDIEC